MFADTILHAALGSVVVLVGSMWFGPKFGPVLRAAGLKILVLALAGREILKAVS